jgi:hypothetical protein
MEHAYLYTFNVTYLLVTNLQAHCDHQVQIYSQFQAVLRLLPQLVLIVWLHQLFGTICLTVLKLQIPLMF